MATSGNSHPRRCPGTSPSCAALRRAGLLTARRHGRYVRCTLKLPDVTALGADLLAAVLR
ncbi:hypothetical protein SY2F82_35180 [Streptomyces sp. Y2F8-2]|nr:hypothetical protein SY2F82_35180 [Streptomyces sp. Y2F8-2]